MLPPELQTRFYRPYISTSTSAPSKRNPTSSFYGTTASQELSRTSLKNSRFSASSFAHNARIAVALVPCAAFLLFDLGGTPVVATLTLGLMISYILDSLNFKSVSFFSVCFSLLSAQIAFFFSSSLFSTFNSIPLALLSTFLCASTTFFIGVWASLQFKWIQIEHPTIVLALERLLFACLPSIASVLFTWATVSALGMNNASYYLMVFNCVFYWLFSIPRVSSFKLKQQQVSSCYHGDGGDVPEDNLILGQLECCMHTLTLLHFPLLFHIASHYSVIFSSPAASVCDLFLLFFIPFLLLLYASTRGALWWVTKNDNNLRSIRVVNGAVALIVVVICLEVRVVFHSFGRYIQVPPPLNYLLVTITMLGGAAAAGAYTMGMIADAFSSVVFTALTVLVSAAAAILVGFPILFLPLPSVVGFYLARFFTKKSLPSYFAFLSLGCFLGYFFSSSMACWVVGQPTSLAFSMLNTEPEKKERVDFRNHVIQWFEVLDGLLGKHWRNVGLAFNCTFLLFGSVIQLIACASNIYYINDNLDKRTWTYIFGACCATTVFIPSFHNYRIWSFLGLVMTTYTAWYLTIASLLHGQVEGVKHSGPSKVVLYFTGATNILYTFGGHAVTVEIMHAMWKPQKFKAIYLLATLYVLTLTLPSAAAVYWAFGDMLLNHSNAFALLPNSPFKNMAVILMLIHQFITFGFACTPLYFVWEKAIGMHECKSMCKRAAVRLPVVIPIWFLAIIFPFFGPINSTVGSLLVSFTVYIIPALAHMITFKSAAARENAVEQPPRFLGRWAGAYTINVFVVVWVFVVGFGFGGWASMTNFVRQIDTFGLFTKCYQCPPPQLPPPHLNSTAPIPSPAAFHHPHHI